MAVGLDIGGVTEEIGEFGDVFTFVSEARWRAAWAAFWLHLRWMGVCSNVFEIWIRPIILRHVTYLGLLIFRSLSRKMLAKSHSLKRNGLPKLPHDHQGQLPETGALVEV